MPFQPIFPGIYAVVGAAALTGAVTHSVSVIFRIHTIFTLSSCCTFLGGHDLLRDHRTVDLHHPSDDRGDHRKCGLCLSAAFGV